MADDKISPFSDDDATQILKGLISPAPAQALVFPPPDHPPHSGPGESTPLTGSLATAPSQATPKRSPAPDPQATDQPKPGSDARRGLAAYLFGGNGGGGNGGPLSTQDSPASGNAAQPVASTPSPASGNDSDYVKILSNGQIGYLPKTNLPKARQRDKNLKVLK